MEPTPRRGHGVECGWIRGVTVAPNEMRTGAQCVRGYSQVIERIIQVNQYTAREDGPGPYLHRMHTPVLTVTHLQRTSPVGHERQRGQRLVEIDK